MKIITSETKEICGESETTTATVFIWANLAGADFTVTRESHPIATGSLQWEDISLLLATLNAAQAS